MALEGEPSEDEKRLRSIEWCAKLLEEPGWEKITWASRVPKGADGGWEDSFFAETLKTDRTIKACLSLFKKSSDAEKGTPAITHVRTLLSVGEGINGWHGVSHGGLIASVLDESMGVLISLNYDSAMQTGFTNRELPIMTAGLKVTYKKPLPTPGEILVNVWFNNVDGRKISVKSDMIDGKGTVFATGEAIWIQVKQKI